MLDVIFNTKQRETFFFILIPTRFAVLAETPFFCRLRIPVIKTAAGIRFLLYAAYSLETIKKTRQRKDLSLSGKRARCGNAYGDIKCTAGTFMALTYKTILSPGPTEALKKTLNLIIFLSGSIPRPNPSPAAN